ncbi:MAG: mechanosensitive ion channel family protein [Acidobacteriia bacterium]|nr:mechanosensitive ion channel family protein [Terriglobia bacterium]
MRPTQKIAASVLVLLLGATVYGLLRTSEPAKVPPSLGKGKRAVPAPAPLVDQSPLKTAQQLAQLATLPEERPLALEALRLADYEVDLAFAAALHEAAEHPPALNAEAKEIQARLQKAQSLLKNDQARVAQLAAAEAQASGEKKEILGDELDLAKAQLELDQDEVDDAKQDLIRAGGDPEDRIQELVQEHEAGAHGNVSAIPNAAAPAEERGLIHRFQQWSALHEKQLRLWRAKQDSEAAAVALAGQHDAHEAQIEAAKEKSPELAHHAKRGKSPEGAPAPAMPPGRSREQSAALVKKTKQIAADQKALATFDKRIGAHKELAGIYGQWIDAVAARQRAVLNHALRGVLIILAIALAGIYFSSLLDKLLGKLAIDRRQVQTLRTVTRVALQVAAALFILLVIFGPPSQLGTFLGLAGAGLTVALKDFIVGFFGWFVLMGKNGMHLGDWVEINGVTGEVVEIGPFHTVLLETGNWTDSGHPTGRRVTFANSFAIEGHYFNFSTTGQWLWDELQLVLPSGEDPYPTVEAIQKLVAAETAQSARLAEMEWRRVTSSKGMSGFSADPAMSVRPGPMGIEVSVRYITRANERNQLRGKLYQEVVRFMGRERAAARQVVVKRAPGGAEPA